MDARQDWLLVEEEQMSACVWELNWPTSRNLLLLQLAIPFPSPPLTRIMTWLDRCSPHIIIITGWFAFGGPTRKKGRWLQIANLVLDIRMMKRLSFGLRLLVAKIWARAYLLTCFEIKRNFGINSWVVWFLELSKCYFSFLNLNLYFIYKFYKCDIFPHAREAIIKSYSFHWRNLAKQSRIVSKTRKQQMLSKY